MARLNIGNDGSVLRDAIRDAFLALLNGKDEVIRCTVNGRNLKVMARYTDDEGVIIRITRKG